MCLPTRWLAGNAKDLGQYGFSYYHMGSVLDLMEDRFEEISCDGSLMMNENYMMDIFSLIAINVDPFAEYLEFMFTEKQSKPVTGCKSNDEKILPYDELRAELFYPSRIDIWQTDGLVSHLGEEAATTFLIEFRNISKATLAYLSSISGKFSKP